MQSRVIIIGLIFFICGCSAKKELNLKQTFSASDPNPFGTMVARQMLTRYYPNNYVVNAKEGVSKNSLMQNDKNSLYFCISNNLFLKADEVNSILNSVYEGNTFFFAASYFDTSLMNAVFCKQADATDWLSGLTGYREASVKLINGLASGKDSVFSYYYYPFSRYFSTINSSYGRIMGYNGDGNPNCIIIYWGKGRLLLHTEPRALSNYFLLKNDNYKYLETYLRVMGDTPEHVIWDDHYRLVNRSSKNPKSTSALNEVLKFPPLAWAFFLLLALLGFYFIFNGKRRQKEIKIIPPNTNSSVAFSETIARLYMQEGDHKAIATKMAAHFQEFLRTNYYLNPRMSREELIDTLSRKSGVAPEHTSSLLDALDKLPNAKKITDKELFTLHNQIQEFYKK